jgi:hypothetical protein
MLPSVTARRVWRLPVVTVRGEGRRVVERALREHGDWSARRIARECGVSHPLVLRYRRQLGLPRHGTLVAQGSPDQGITMASAVSYLAGKASTNEAGIERWAASITGTRRMDWERNLEAAAVLVARMHAAIRKGSSRA